MRSKGRTLSETFLRHEDARGWASDDATEVRALGTRFAARRDAGEVSVTLVEGKVAVRKAQGEAAWTMRAKRPGFIDRRQGVAGVNSKSW